MQLALIQLALIQLALMQVKGVTTAVAVWLSAGIGVLCGGKMYFQVCLCIYHCSSNPTSPVAASVVLLLLSRPALAGQPSSPCP